MGNHQSHEGKVSGGETGGSSHGSGSSTPRNGSRRGDGPEPQEKPQSAPFLIVEKLAKILVQKSQKEDGVNGVTENSFTKYLFPQYPEFATAFYHYMHKCGKCKNRHISQTVFRQQSERILGMLDDAVIIEAYVRMFTGDHEEMTPDLMKSLLYTSYTISMDHCPEGPQTCMLIDRSLAAIVDGCFNKKDSHSVGFVVRWIEEHTHRLIMPLHRYSVHVLSTRYRSLSLCTSAPQWDVSLPVLEARGGPRGGLLAPSAAWMLAAAAPPLYCMPATNNAKHTGAGSAMAAWLARQVCVLPLHWTPLYASNEDGLGANRFLHHTLAYRGPTLVVVEFAEFQVVVCNPNEWRETHQYTGGPDSALIQLYPTLSVVEHAPKMLYLNTSIRGYPKGLRAGSDPRKPLLSIDEGFEHVLYKEAPYPLKCIEVWGCGDTNSRETQLEIKKWQVREAERQRQVKLSAADWMEHPDRYLLELAGRPQYNNSAS